MNKYDHDLFERDDDLSHCKVCGGAEGSLTTLCPGRRMTNDEEKAVYAGKLDFNHSTMSRPIWWIPKET